MITCGSKKKSAIGNMLSCMLGILIMFIVIYYGVDITSQLGTAVKKSRIERKYVLIMETEGYLTASAQGALIKELEAIGVSNISFAGTTLLPAGYGKTVVLSITGVIVSDRILGISDRLQFIRKDGGNEFRIYQTSTAKY